MSLLLRHDPTEAVMRSVGDPPNGILSVEKPVDGPMSFVVDPSMMPSGDVPAGTARARYMESADGRLPQATPVELDDVVDALEGDVERETLWVITRQAVGAYTQIHLFEGQFEEIIRACEFGVSVRERLLGE